jgi:hypothetical protein
MVYGCEGDLRSDLVIEILQHVTVKILGVVNCDLLWDSIAIDNVLPENFFDCHGGCIGDRLWLNPFCEVFHCHNAKGVIALWVEFADNVDAQLL